MKNQRQSEIEKTNNPNQGGSRDSTKGSQGSVKSDSDLRKDKQQRDKH